MDELLDALRATQGQAARDLDPRLPGSDALASVGAPFASSLTSVGVKCDISARCPR
jgi:hypothetical protein